MAQNYIYIVFSATPYRMGKAIRRITKQQYNHISIALDEELSVMYGFARRYYRTPLYGGFVQETQSRYFLNGNSTEIKVCKVPISDNAYIHIQEKLTAMCHRAEDYLYNHLSALGALFHKVIPAENAYTCVEFCAEILRDAGLNLSAHKYYAIGDLENILQKYAVYEGIMPNAGEKDTAYYSKRPVRFPQWNTLRDMAKLLPRARIKNIR